MIKGFEMNKLQPTLKDWENIYQKTIEFKKLAPWEWMTDAEIFGIKDESYKEIGYCCVLGNIGEFFALTVYLGDTGLEAYRKMQTGEIKAGDFELLYLQKCLMVSFENRNTLDQKDLEIIKKLDLKFRGAKGWPQFRKYIPGSIPWYLNKGDVQFLLIALEQTIEMADRLKKDINLLITSEEGEYLIRSSKKIKGQKIWEEEWIKYNRVTTEDNIKYNFQIDEIRLQKIKEEYEQKHKSWEIDWFYSPFHVTDKEIPYYPVMYLCVDTESFYILDNSIFEDKEAGFKDYYENIIKIIEKNKTLPQKILVKKRDIYNYLKPITEYLGISIEIINNLQAINDVKKSLLGYFKK